MYSIREAAEILGLSAPTLRRWEKRGIITPVRTRGNHRRFSAEMIKSIYGHYDSIEEEEKEMKKAEKIAIYARVSTHDQKKTEICRGRLIV